MWLVGESALQRYVAQRRFRLQHVLSRELDASPDHEGMRRLSKGAPKGAREMRFAQMNKLAEFRDKHRTCDMTINVVTHFARLPRAQAPPSAWSRSRGFGIDLLAQQRGCLNYRAVNCLLVIYLTHSRIEQRDYVVHPFAWPCRTYLRDSLCLSEVSAHNLLQTSPAALGGYVPALLMTC
jgi:hypothetical protein